MMAQVMGYTAAIALLFALAGHGLERANLPKDGWKRWIWATTMLLSLAYPAVILLRAPHSVAMQPTVIRSAAITEQLAPVQAAARTPVITMPEANAPLSGNAPVKEQRRLSGAALNLSLKLLWISSSSILALWLLIGRLGLYRSALAWPEEQVDGYRVRVAENTGPAVVGFWRPFIVVPRWLQGSSIEIRSMVLRHEAQHLAAGDTGLLLIGLIFVVLTPWNIPLWWQLARLRFALEVDCDARVRRGGADINIYAKMLLAVAERRSRIPVSALAMSTRRSHLERRVRALLVTTSRPQWVTAGAIAASVVFVASATQLPEPQTLRADIAVSGADRAISAVSHLTSLQEKANQANLPPTVTGPAAGRPAKTKSANALVVSEATSANGTTSPIHHMSEAQVIGLADAQARRSELDLSYYHAQEPIFVADHGAGYWEVWYTPYGDLDDCHSVDVDDRTCRTKMTGCLGTN